MRKYICDFCHKEVLYTDTAGDYLYDFTIGDKYSIFTEDKVFKAEFCKSCYLEVKRLLIREYNHIRDE